MTTQHCHDKNCDDKIKAIEERLDEKLEAVVESLGRIEVLLTGGERTQDGVLFRLSWVERHFKMIAWLGGGVLTFCVTVTSSIVVIVIVRAMSAAAGK